MTVLELTPVLIPKTAPICLRGSLFMWDAPDGTFHFRKILVGMTEWRWRSGITHLPDEETEAQRVTEVSQVITGAKLGFKPRPD